MKGIVFKELLNMVEETFGEELTEKILSKSNLESGGAYTSVGTYDHGEILELVTNLSNETSTPVNGLVKAFGKYMVTVFKKSHPTFFNKPDVLSFLKTVHGIIHVEVKKLYPDAELPKFEYEEPSENKLIMYYSSSRPFADLAEGLIEGVVESYGESIEISWEDTSNGGNTSRKFVLERS